MPEQPNSERERRIEAIDFDRIPIGRHWGLSLLLFASDEICELFGLTPPAPVHREEGKRDA